MPIDPQCAVLLLDKPEGPTSYRTARKAAQALRVKKVGHTGTLDSNVSGMLVIALGQATKAVHLLEGLDKGYVGTMRFESPQNEARVRDAMTAFVGRITQIPPLKSAVRRRPRERTVHRFEITEWRDTEADFAADVEAGTYIRAMLRDLGVALDVPIEMAALRRVFVGPFRVEECVPLRDVDPQALIPVQEALARVGVELLTVTPEEEADVRNGFFIRLGVYPADGTPRVLLDPTGRLLALTRPREEGLHAYRVFVYDDTSLRGSAPR